MNKFVSPTTGATISSAQFGILLALLFMPASTLWSRAIFAFAAADSGHLDLRLVHPAHPVQGCGHGPSGGHHVRQCHRRHDQLSGL
ncbi:MAG: hypothetical protein ACLVD8_26430 [Enterocloster sp.]|uniref:hypothetical protein n=1 Tax=Enterocloster sp. TaxID=2719315 RepID=UPI00399A7915